MPKLFFGVLGCALVSSTSLIATNASAKQEHNAISPEISVTAKSESIPQWSSRIARNLDKQLRYPRPIGRAGYERGVVRVKFHCSESGLPDGVALASSSLSLSLDHAAMTAVRSISTMHPLPQGVRHDQALEAWIIFADDEKDVARMARSLEKEAALALAQSNTQNRGSKPLRIILASR